MPSFSIPLTGLTADSTALNTIANNLANLNTTAFKAQNAQFADLFYQQIGSSGANDPLLVGEGTQVSTTETEFTQGSLTTTGNASDVAISGNGFFLVDNNGTIELTRAGDFQTDASGNLITADGLGVLGYPATAGVVNTNSPVTALQLPVGAVEPPKATTSFQLNANLNASSITSGTPLDTTITFYDSLGVSHVATVALTPAALPAPPAAGAVSAWSYSLNLPSTDYSGVAPAPVTGTLQFNSSGVLVSPAANPTINFGGTFADGANALNGLTWNLYDLSGNPTVTQVASASAVSSSNQNGYASGSYKGFSIDAQGVISATFSNSQTEAIGQLALGTVADEQALDRLGSNEFGATVASGAITIGTAGNGGRGTLTGGSLEASNVDISTEFSDLIVAQRAFEANSKAITTFDTVTQETINLIR